MSDQYERIRALPFPTLAGLLGLDLGNFKQRKHGQEFYGPCPIHNPKQNSTSFSYATDGRFNCFSCNAKGRGAIDLAKLVKHLGFQDAVKWLQPSCSAEATQTPANGEKTPPKPILAQSDDVLQPLAKDTWSKHQVPCPWLEQRVPDARVREVYGCFCYNNPARKSAYSGRVMLPVKNAQGVLYGYLGRSIAHSEHSQQNQTTESSEPKYLFPKNLPKSKFLFGAWELATGQYLPAVRQGETHTGGLPLKVVYLLESPFAVMKFAMMGLPAVAAYGWSVSAEQTELLQSLAKGILFLPDRNKSNDAQSSLLHLSRRLWVRFPPLPDGIDDPEQLSREQIFAL